MRSVTYEVICFLSVIFSLFSLHLLQLSTGKLSPGSYVPDGLSLAQYQKIREAEDAKKAANYDKNVKKAFKFLGFDEFYSKRGTDLNQSWVKSPTKGHRMAKLKYDYEQGKKFDGSK